MADLSQTPTPFNFGQAITQIFRSPFGAGFGWRLVLWTSVMMTVVYAVAMPMFASVYGDLMTMNWENMQALGEGRVNPTTEDELAIFKAMALPYAIMFFGMWFICASADAALHRAVLKGQAHRGIPHRFGADELRVMLAQLGVWSVVFAVYFLGAIVLGLVVGAVMMGSPGLGIVLGIIAGFAVASVIWFFAVRLSPAAALSVYNKKAHLLAGNKPSKGRFWWMTLAYLVVGVGGYILYFIIFSIIMGIAGSLLGVEGLTQGMMGLGDTDPGPAFEAAIAKFQNPLVMICGLVALFILCLLSTLWLLSIAGIGTYVVKLFKGEDRISTFD